MAKSRKDNKGRVLRKRETARSSNGMYQYAYIDAFGKRQYIYSNDLLKLRQKEEEILRDRFDGINSEQAKTQSLNDIFDKYMATRKDLAAVYFAGKMNKSEQRIYMPGPKTEAGIRKIPIVKEVRNALEEIKQYQHDNGIICATEIDGYNDFIFLNRFGKIL